MIDINMMTKIIKKHGPAILTGLGITALVGAGVRAVQVTPKACDIINEEIYIRKYEDAPPVSTRDKVKMTWKLYLPSVVMAGIGISCILWSDNIHNKRNTVLAGAYYLTESAFKKYKEATRDRIGEEEEREIQKTVRVRELEKNPPTSVNVHGLKAENDVLCYEILSGRYFYSNKTKIKEAQNEMNYQMLNEMSISLNEVFYYFGLDETALGKDLGWNIAHGQMDIKFESMLTPQDGLPCMVIDYHIMPTINFY